MAPTETRHAEFSIPVSELDAAGKSYEFPVRAAWVRGELEGNEATTSGKDGSLEVRLSRSGNDVVVTGRLQAELTAPCARCLEPATIPIDATLGLLMVPESGAKSAKHDDKEEQSFDTEEADVVPFDGETVILDDVVRDELVLQVPMIPLCSEDCAGMSEAQSQLSASAGKDSESIDPRLLPLLRFKKSTKE